MILALLWLTVSTPFVFAAKQKLAKADKIENISSIPEDETETAPLGNNTEEKVPSSTSLSEEFLHDNHHDRPSFIAEELKHTGAGNAGTYEAFHGELLVPPPNMG